MSFTMLLAGFCILSLKELMMYKCATQLKFHSYSIARLKMIFSENLLM